MEGRHAGAAVAEVHSLRHTAEEVVEHVELAVGGCEVGRRSRAGILGGKEGVDLLHQLHLLSVADASACVEGALVCNSTRGSVQLSRSTTRIRSAPAGA